MSVKTRDRQESRPTTRSRKKSANSSRIKVNVNVPPPVKHHLRAWFLLAAVLAILAPRVISVTFEATGRVISTIPGTIDHLLHGDSNIAPLFSPAVQHW